MKTALGGHLQKVAAFREKKGRNQKQKFAESVWSKAKAKVLIIAYFPKKIYFEKYCHSHSS